MMGYSDGWFSMGWMWIFWILLIAGLVLLIVLLVRITGGGLEDRGRNTRGSRAREILAERYARGELGTEEYQERLRVLDDGR